MRLENKKAVITGAASGFGRETAIRFAKEGADVAVVDINDKQAEEVVKEIAALGRKGLYVKTDVTNENEVKKAVDKIISEFGRIDILINDVGFSRSKPIQDLKLEEWEKGISVNLTSTFLCTREVIPYMIKQQYGKIVNLASICAQTARMVAVDYSCAKSGVAGLTRTVALQVAKDGINVNAVAPGPIETPIWKSENFKPEVKAALIASIPFKRLGTMADIANLLLFLSSDEAGWITGEVVSINGGAFIG